MIEDLFTTLPQTPYLNSIWWHHRLCHPFKHRRFQKRRGRVTKRGYSYCPYDEQKALFIHIPKCAGISVNHAIYGSLGGGHQTLNHYMRVFPPEQLLSYFKFTIVRNPWDRLVSAYFFLQKGGFEEADRCWFNNELSEYSGFSDFVQNWLTRETIWTRHHFRPQYHYFLDRNRKLPLDFIGHFETIDRDFDYIASRIGIEKKLPQHNASQHRNYRDYYDNATRAIVEKVYAEDIGLLGYKF